MRRVGWLWTFIGLALARHRPSLCGKEVFHYRVLSRHAKRRAVCFYRRGSLIFDTTIKAALRKREREERKEERGGEMHLRLRLYPHDALVNCIYRAKGTCAPRAARKNVDCMEARARARACAHTIGGPREDEVVKGDGTTDPCGSSRRPVTAPLVATSLPAKSRKYGCRAGSRVPRRPRKKQHNFSVYLSCGIRSRSPWFSTGQIQARQSEIEDRQAPTGTLELTRTELATFDVPSRTARSHPRSTAATTVIFRRPRRRKVAATSHRDAIRARACAVAPTADDARRNPAAVPGRRVVGGDGRWCTGRRRRPHRRARERSAIER